MHLLLLEIREKHEHEKSIYENCLHILSEYKKTVVAEHSKQVAAEAKRLAMLFKQDCNKAEVAGILHDISAVIPNDMRIEVAESLCLDILSEERAFPLIIHQKLSMEIAKMLFGITDECVLSAICCHSTLKTNPTELDMILFIADKIMWDQEGVPPYHDIVQAGLAESLEHGVFAFVKYLYDNKANLKVIHPWLVDAYNYLSLRLGFEPDII